MSVKRSALLFCAFLVYCSTLETNPNNNSSPWLPEKDIFGNGVIKAEYCEGAICVRKCCDFGFVVNITSEEYTGSAECVAKKMSNYNAYVYSDNYYDKQLTRKKANDIFKFLSLQNRTESGTFTKDMFNLYLLESGVLMAEKPNAYDRWQKLDNDQFCVDLFMRYGSRVLQEDALLFLTDDGEDEQEHLSTFKIAAVMCYFFILATFFWLNVMSFDIFFTFRYGRRNSNRREENHNFLQYCLYGFGCPLTVTVVFCFLNYLPMDKINPAVVTPGITDNGCFLGGAELFLYLYIPMSVLIVANCVLFVAHTRNICAARRAARSAAMDSTANERASQPQYILYVKLFLLMGISFALEVLSSFNPKFALWMFTDAWNLFVGIFIFYMFVCNKKTMKLIAARYHALRAPEKVNTGRSARAVYSDPTLSTLSTSSSVFEEVINLNTVNTKPKG